LKLVGSTRMASVTTDTRTSIRIDAEHGFIRRYAITPANIHDTQMIPQVLDPENRDDLVWADSGYAGALYEDLLEVDGFSEPMS